MFEHKSTPDEWVAFQLLRYMVRIWEPAARLGKANLQPIFPLVLYHGKSKWEVSPRFSDLIEWSGAAALRRYSPDYEYYLCDLSKYEEILGTPDLRVALLLMKYIFRRELRGKLVWILSQLPVGGGSAIESLWTILIYISAASEKLTEKEWTEVLAEAFPGEEGGVMFPLAEKWIKEGHQQGLQQGTLEVTLLQLRRRFGPLEANTERQISTLPIEKLRELGEALLDFATMQDLVAWAREHTLTERDGSG